VRATIEALETRTLLCGSALDPALLAKVLAARAEAGGQPDGGSGLIVWDNEGSATSDTDRFNEVFGNTTDAELARGVVRAVIRAFENTITSFNYSPAPSDPSFHLHLDIADAGSGFAAGSAITGMWNDKPKAGVIGIGGGDFSPQRGWYLDEAPDDYAEFNGAFVNPFAAEALNGVAHDRPDLYSRVAHEIAHCLGLNNVARWNNRTANTNVPDNVNGNIGTFWTFTGPSVQHLMTSFNGGVNSGAAVHTADAGASVTVNNVNWRGAADLGNAGLAQGARFLIPDTLSLMYRDAYGYTTTNANVRPTFHAVHDPAARTLLIRGGAAGSGSDDVITIGRSGSMISVSVDVGNDVPGTGALPGAGNLPAYTSLFDSSQVSTITIRGLDGDDTINVNGVFANTTVNVFGAIGNDTIHLTPVGRNLDLISGTLRIFGDADGDALIIHDDGHVHNDTFAVSSTAFSRDIVPQMTLGTLESIRIDAGGGNNTFNVTAVSDTTTVGINAGGGNDTINVGGATGGNVDPIDGNVNFDGQGGTNTFNYNDANNAANAQTYTLTSVAATRTGALGIATFANVTDVNLNAGSGTNTINVNSTAANTGTTVNANGGADTITVDTSAAVVLTVNGGDADDTVNLINLGGLQNIVVFNGNAGAFDALNFNDTNNLVDDTYTINSGSMLRTRAVNVFHGTFERITISAGGGDNQFDVDTTATGTTHTINAGAGADALDVTLSAGNLGNADGAIVFNGQDGSDAATLWDNVSTANDNYTVTATQATRAGFGGLTYGTCEGFALNASRGANVIDVSTAFLCPVTVNANNGTDTINVNETALGTPVRIPGSAGNDAVRVNADGLGQAAASFTLTQRIGQLSVFNGGNAGIFTGAGKVLTMSGLSITGNGVFNMTDNDAIVDYTGASPMNAVTSLLTSGYANGGWLGTGGIHSSSAALFGNGRTAIGAAEATDLFGTFPATFSGQTVDSTSILLKYTAYGDANLDGQVNLADFNRLAGNFGQAARRWVHGDTNFDGMVNLTDFNRLAANFGATGFAPTTGGEIGKPASTVDADEFDQLADTHQSGRIPLSSAKTGVSFGLR
jgi:hypothetical protein